MPNIRFLPAIVPRNACRLSGHDALKFAFLSSDSYCWDIM